MTAPNRRGKIAPQSDWPRTYLLQIYADAVKNGHILLHPIAESKARSLTQALYNLRRRSTTTNAAFILPEYHAVTVGKWRPDAGGTLPVYYTTTDFGLPQITPAPPEETISVYAIPAEDRLPANMPIDPPELNDMMAEEEIDSYIEQLLRDSRKGNEDN